MKQPMIRALVFAGVSVSVGLITSCASATRPLPPMATPSGVRFVLLYPAATTVALAGSFNNWSTSANQLVREGTRGLWTTTVSLPAGEHLFMYVIDGTTWTTPPMAEYFAEDGFGARNGVVVIK